MTALRKPHMSVDEFLPWSEAHGGRWELIDGEPMRMEAERVAHVRVKAAAFDVLRQAIRRAKVPCEAFPDGAAVRISKKTAYEPDVLVRRGPRLPGRALEVPDPVIVVEVLSPGTAGRDYGEKVEGYFSLASVEHYLIVDPEQKKLVHCRRGQGDAIERRVVAGTLRLDPPGLEIAAAALFSAD